MEFILIGAGIIILGVSAYYLVPLNSFNQPNNQQRRFNTETANGVLRVENQDDLLHGLDLSRYEPLSLPASKKPIFILLTLLCFGASLFCVFQLLGSAKTVGQGFWLFVGVCVLFGFGCYFISLANKAGDELVQEVKRVTEINTHRIQQKKQAVQNHIAEKEEAAQAFLRSKQLENELLRQETAKLDYTIIQSNAPDAEREKIPVSSFTRIRTNNFETQVTLENLKKAKKIETDAQKEQVQNQNQTDKDKAHDILNASERAEYPRLKSDYDEKLKALNRELAELQAKTDPTPSEKADIDHLTTVIKETKEEKDAIRGNFLRSSHGQEVERTTQAP